MGARRLEARLAGRLAVVIVVVIVGVACAAVGLADRIVDTSDTDVARARARDVLDAVTMELGEGDPFELATSEVIGGSRRTGVRTSVWDTRRAAGDAALPRLASGVCATVAAADGDGPWRACSASSADLNVVSAISIAGHRAAVRDIARAMAALAAFALLATAFAVRRALRGPLSEVAALAEWTASVVATSERPPPPPPASTIEIARLQTAFEALVREILGLLERERASSAHIAHEIRTPLTAMLAEIARVQCADLASAEALARVRQDAARLGDVVEAILLLSRSQPQARPRAFLNVADVARDLLPTGARLDGPDEAVVEGDERLVRLAVQNLLDNAGKHGGGASSVRLTREGSRVRVAVLDQGPGLAAESRARMFDRYWRGRADTEGRGLGLALVRAVAELHGGAAEAAPAGDGSGFQVSFTLDGLVDWHDGPV